MTTITKKILTGGILFLMIFPPAFCKITKGPYLTRPQQTSMTISWESDLSEKALVNYGKNSTTRHAVTVRPTDSKDGLFLYSVTIGHLKSGKKYYYRVQMSDTSTALLYFRTAPSEDAPIDFMAIGDSRSGHDVYNKISELIESTSAELVISMGDLVAKGGAYDQWGPHYFQPAADLIDHIPVISTLGDHDNVLDSAEIFNYYFRPVKDHHKIWFSYDYGPAHFISLDYRCYNDPEMIEWFKKDMENSHARWNFVYLHRPSYNTGGHRSNWGAGIWPDLYRKYKVDIVFAGHSHLYERFYPMRPSDDPQSWPVTYITTGGAGAELYQAVPNPNLAVTKSVNHFISVHLTPDSLILTTYLPDKSVLDHFVITKNKAGEYDPAYLSLVKPQEYMDAYMTFANRLLLKFSQKPEDSIPATAPVTFTSKVVDQQISFTVQLSEVSSENYTMDPIQGVLNKGDRFQDTVRIYTKKPYQIDRIYFVPPIKLNVSFRMENGESGIAIGRQCRYYPNKDQRP